MSKRKRKRGKGIQPSPGERPYVLDAFGAGGRHRIQQMIYADRMRRDPSEPELTLHQALVDADIYHEWQRVMSPFIVDFYMPQWSMVVEVDGPEHQRPERIEADRKRTKRLRKNFDVQMVMRVENAEVEQRAKAVAARVRVIGERRKR